MNILKRGGVAILAAALGAILVTSTVAAAPASVQSFSLDDRWSVEEPDGSVVWYSLRGTVRLVTTPGGRTSATVHARERQTIIGPTGTVTMEARGVSMQHVVTRGEDTIMVHLTSRGRWVFGDSTGSQTLVFHLVKGKVVVDHVS